MRIYKIEFDPGFQRVYFSEKMIVKWRKRPGRPKEPHFELGPRAEDPMFEFDGRAKRAKWQTPRVFSVRQDLEQEVPNLWGIDDDAIGLDEEAMKTLGPLIRDCGEFLPLNCETEPVTLFHVTRVANCLNSRESGLFDFSFIEAKLPSHCVFKIPQRRFLNFCIERTGDPRTEFRAAVEHYGLTGLAFCPVWESGAGKGSPAPISPSVKAIPSQKLREISLKDNVREEIASYTKAGRRALRLNTQTKPKRVQAAIQTRIDNFRKRKRHTEKEAEDAALLLGCLWGQTLCDEMGWEWIALRQGKRSLYGVASPKRESVALPMQHILSLFKNPDEEANTLLLYNMIRTGEMTVSLPKSYTIIG
jgi:hypothetical protein